MTKYIITLLLLFFFLAVSAQEKKTYKIDLKIKGLEDSVLYLANYYGDKTFLVDTASKKGKNSYVFEGEKWLDGGVYIVVGQEKNTIFEFLISDSQDLKLDSDMDGLIEKMKVKGSNENALFFDYISYTNIKLNQITDYQKRIKSLAANQDSISLLNKKIEELNYDIANYKESIIEAYPEAFISHFFLAMKSPETQNFPVNSKQDSIRAFQDYKKRYWEYFNFDDDRLIRTPVFQSRLDYYFDQIAFPSADSLIMEIDAFLKRLPEKSEMYKHSLWNLTLKFDQSNHMGYDAILVHLADNYYSKSKAPWMNANVLKNILDEANKRRNTLIGQQAPNLIMQNPDLNPISMYGINKKYTLLYFWDPNCGHCKVETPDLLKFYRENAQKLDLEVFAVCADTNMTEMKKYITDNKMEWINVNGPRSYTQNFHDLYNIYSTPVLYLLDNNKIIIAKQISSNQLLNFITQYESIIKPKE